MATSPDSIDQLSQVISHVIAPAFMLGAVTSFVSIVTSRIDVVLGRIRTLNAIRPDDAERAHLREDIQRLSRRLVLLRRCLLITLMSGVVTMALMIVSFGLAILGVQHVWSVAFLFIIALTLFCAAMVILGRDGMISIHERDYF
jgi:putative Mn2+ efflux pump MntP